MTLRHLKIFVTVYHESSITKAAGLLHLAQPSVSLAVRELEDYYGIRLFDRMSRRIYPTDQARRFYDYALHITSLFDEMEKGIRSWDSLGSLRVGSSIALGAGYMPEAVKLFHTLYPAVKVSVLIKNSLSLEQAVLENRIDFAFIEGIPASRQISQIPFMDDRLCLICGPDHPLAAQDVIPVAQAAQYDFLLREEGSAGREIFESIMTLHGLTVLPAWESASTTAILRAVRQGLGITLLPWLQVCQELKEGLVHEIRLEGVDLSRRCSIIYHSNKYLTDSAKTFMKLFSRCPLPPSGIDGKENTAGQKHKDGDKLGG